MIKLTTDRLVIRDHIGPDISDLHSLLSDPVAMRFIPDLFSTSLSDSEENLRVAIEEAASGNRSKYFFAITKEEKYIGEIGFTILENTHAFSVAELGYFIKPEFWGKGYVTEAARAVLDFAFDVVGVTKIITGCNAKNIASERIMNKLGMIKTDHLQAHSLLEGEWCDRVCYELIGKIYRHIKDRIKVQNETGKSAAHVYQFYTNEDSIFLKIDHTGSELNREVAIINWLTGKLPIPEVIEAFSMGDRTYLLMKAVQGQMVKSAIKAHSPESIVKALANGVNRLHSIDVTDCPFENTLDMKLTSARKLLENNQISTEDWEENTLFESPEALLEYLENNRPEEELVFTHGDYTKENIFIEGPEVTGFIDLGRAGIADQWQDLALCIRTLRKLYKSETLIALFLKIIEIPLDEKKLDYYIMLDELF